MKRSLVLGFVVIAAFGCYEAREEVEDSGGTGGTLGGTGSTTGGTSAATGTTASGTASTTGGSPAQALCNGVETTLAALTSCGLPVGMGITSAQCLSEAVTCTPGELMALQSFLTCVNALDCSDEETFLVGLINCENLIASVTCVNLMGGTSSVSAVSSSGSVGSFSVGSSTGGIAGETTGGFGTGSFGTGSFAAATATAGTGFGAGATGTGGNGTVGFGTSGFLDGGRRPPFDGGITIGGGTPFCGACTTDRQCGPPNACIPDGTGQDVCGQSCTGGMTCPSGATCQSTTDVRGKTVTQCVPASCEGDGG